MLTVVSLVFWPFVVITVPLFTFVALLVRVLAAPFDRRRLLTHLVCSSWGRMLIAVNPLWRCRVLNRERVPWNEGVILVVNHASLLDILVMFCLWRPFRGVSKKENFEIPFLGWAIKAAAYIPVARGNRDSVVQMMRRCEESLRIKMPVLFYPEGTRSPTDGLLPFKPGAFELAMKTGTRVIPIAMHGTREALPKHGLILKSRMDAVLEVLEPLDPADHARVEDLMAAARSAIEVALNKQEATRSAA